MRASDDISISGDLHFFDRYVCSMLYAVVDLDLSPFWTSLRGKY